MFDEDARHLSELEAELEYLYDVLEDIENATSLSEARRLAHQALSHTD